jgi:ubiquinol-cytochrome c reductase cytochrome b subunit
MVWLLGVVIFLLMMATAFMGYVLPWGQMSFWGAKVITGLFGAIPLVGEPIQIWLLGGFAPDNAALNRFFSLHYLLPFVIVGVVILHIWALHIPGSSNPTGVEVKSEERYRSVPPLLHREGRLRARRLFLISCAVLFFAPNMLGHPDNYIPANPMRRRRTSFPNGTSGRSTRSCAPSRRLLLHPGQADGRARHVRLDPGVVLPALAGYLAGPFGPLPPAVPQVLLVRPDPDDGGAVLLRRRPAEEPYVMLSQIASLYYFAHFLIILPIVSSIEKPDPLPYSITEAVLGHRTTRPSAGMRG